MYPGIELRLLRYVCAVARELHFRRAAERLYLAQPSLSKQIRELEDYLGTRLFERNRQGVKLTASGEAFVPEAQSALLHAERAVELARAAKGREPGPFTVGYSPFVDFRLLSMAKDHFGRTHPESPLSFQSVFTAEQLDGLLRGSLEAGFVLLPASDPSLGHICLVREPLVVALPERHPLARKEEVEVADLHREALVTIRRGMEPGPAERLDRALRLVGAKPEIVQETSSVSEALDLVAENNVAAVVLLARKARRDGVVLRRFKDDLMHVETGIAFRRDNASVRLQSLQKFLGETFLPLSRGAGEKLTETAENQLRLF